MQLYMDYTLGFRSLILFPIDLILTILFPIKNICFYLFCVLIKSMVRSANE